MLGGEAALVTSGPAPPEGLYLTRVYYEHNSWSDEDATHEVLP
jgi:tRNA U38,U39,U40 pseudouridine synthase TruA